MMSLSIARPRPFVRRSWPVVVIAAAILVASTGLHAATAAPIPVTNADGETRQPFQTELALFQGDGSSFPTTGSFRVPAGKVLVIQGISAEAYALNSNRVVLQVSVTAGGVTVRHYVGILSPGVGAANFVLPLTPAMLHADPGSAVTFTVQRDNPPGSNVGYYDDVIFTGYLVNM